jgi:4-carboxymuconolactone decarboxylase
VSRRNSALARVCVATALGDDRVTAREIRSALRAGVAVDDLREAILQTYLFAGFPRAINGLWTLNSIAGSGARGPDLRKRGGEGLCRRIYGRDYEPMMRKMRSLSPDLARWILDEGYGKVLSRPHFTPRERELMIVPTLAALRAWRQLPSHVKGGLRVGASAGEIRRVVTACRGLVSKTAIQRVQEVLKAGS